MEVRTLDMLRDILGVSLWALVMVWCGTGIMQEHSVLSVRFLEDTRYHQYKKIQSDEMFLRYPLVNELKLPNERAASPSCLVAHGSSLVLRCLTRNSVREMALVCCEWTLGCSPVIDSTYLQSLCMPW